MTVNNNGSQKSGIKLILRALKHKNYRLFFAGQGISLIGTWMQQLAMGWLVYRLTHSAFYLGLVPFCSQLPVFGAPIAGVFADHFSKRKILVVTQFLSMIHAMILAALLFFGKIHLGWIIFLSIFIGLVNSFDIPTRQSFVYEMVDDEEDLTNAIALNSLIFNIARLIGPSIAGFLIVLTGSEFICFLINSISFLAVIFSLLAMKLTRPYKKKSASPEILEDLKDGANYAFGFIPIKTVILFTAMISMFAVPYVVLMPIFAKDILHGDSRTLGFLTGCIGLGALIGAIFLASQKNARKFDNITVFAACVFACGLIGFSFSRVLWLSMLLIVLPGFGLMVQAASTNIILQTIVDDDKRGRVMSFHAMAFIGMAPFGNLLAGLTAERYGAPFTLLLCGIFSIAVMLYFLMQVPRIRELVHPIYVRKGIIPEVAQGLDTAAKFSAEIEE